MNFQELTITEQGRKKIKYQAIFSLVETRDHLIWEHMYVKIDQCWYHVDDFSPLSLTTNRMFRVGILNRLKEHLEDIFEGRESRKGRRKEVKAISRTVSKKEFNLIAFSSQEWVVE